MGCIRVSDCSERTRTGRDACEVIEHKWFSTLDLKKMEAKEMTPPYKPNVLWVALVSHSWVVSFSDVLTSLVFKKECVAAKQVM